MQLNFSLGMYDKKTVKNNAPPKKGKLHSNSN
jgi:hypothetical protein